MTTNSHGNAKTQTGKLNHDQISLPNISADHLTAEELYVLDLITYINIPENKVTNIEMLIAYLKSDERLKELNNPDKYLELGVISQSTYEKKMKTGEAFTFSGEVTHEEVKNAVRVLESSPRLQSLKIEGIDPFNTGNRVITYVNPTAEEFVVTIRGTGADQWLDNSHGFFHPSSLAKEGVWNQVIPLYESKYWGYDLTWSGHSKGGNSSEKNALESGLRYKNENVIVRGVNFDSQAQSAAYLQRNPEAVQIFGQNPYNIHISAEDDYVHGMGQTPLSRGMYQTVLCISNPTDRLIEQHYMKTLIDWTSIANGGPLRFVGWDKKTGLYQNNPEGAVSLFVTSATQRIATLYESNPDLAEMIGAFLLSSLQVNDSGFEGHASGQSVSKEELLAVIFSSEENIKASMLLLKEIKSDLDTLIKEYPKIEFALKGLGFLGNLLIGIKKVDLTKMYKKEHWFSAFETNTAKPTHKGLNTNLPKPTLRKNTSHSDLSTVAASSSGRIKFSDKDITIICDSLRKADQYIVDLERSLLLLQRELSREKDDDLSASEKREILELERSTSKLLGIVSTLSVKHIRTDIEQRAADIHNVDKKFAKMQLHIS